MKVYCKHCRFAARSYSSEKCQTAPRKERHTYWMPTKNYVDMHIRNAGNDCVLYRPTLSRRVGDFIKRR